jgi:hypothetical protein
MQRRARSTGGDAVPPLVAKASMGVKRRGEKKGVGGVSVLIVIAVRASPPSGLKEARERKKKTNKGEHTSSNTSPKTRSAFGLCPGSSGAVAPAACPCAALPPALLNILANAVKKFRDAFGSLVRSDEDRLADSLSYSRRRCGSEST